MSSCTWYRNDTILGMNATQNTCCKLISDLSGWILVIYLFPKLEYFKVIVAACLLNSLKHGQGIKSVSS